MNYLMRNNPPSSMRGCGQTENCQPRCAADNCQPRCAADNCQPRCAADNWQQREAMESGSRMRGSACETMNRMQLLQHINEVSFAVVDSLLYLDTHPCDSAALAYNREMVNMRKEAMAVYTRRFGPLTVDCTSEAESSRWEWVMQPWPWETVSKGGCR